MNWVEELATRKRLIEEQSVGVWKDFVDHIVAVVDSHRLHFSTGNPKSVTKERNDLAHYIVVECREDIGADTTIKLVKLELIQGPRIQLIVSLRGPGEARSGAANEYLDFASDGKTVFLASGTTIVSYDEASKLVLNDLLFGDGSSLGASALAAAKLPPSPPTV
jgi:hypothetical protein